MKLLATAAAAAALVFVAQGAQAGATFDAIKAKGFVQCGMNGGVGGFGAPDAKGEMKGIDVDLCRAVAAAMFGDANKVKHTPLTALAGSRDVQCTPVAAARHAGGSCRAFGREHGHAEDFGHFDLLMGTNAPSAVWPELLGWLESHD